ncbi:MAG: tetratricopeptide repeat protein [Akkermansiaceae bacterium]|nr:tetratricopeptide repeat protein [Verrucomicrobiales bacterium]
MKSLVKNLWVWAVLGTAVVCFTGCSAEAKKKRHQTRADELFKAGNYTKAEIEYFNVLSLERTNGHAIRQLGVLYEENGRPQRAYPFLLKALEMYPDDNEIRLKLGSLQSVSGDSKQARTNALIVLEKDPKNELAPLLLADTAKTPQDIQEIRNRIEQIRQSNGDTAPLRLALGTLLTREGKSKEADLEIRKALELDPKFAPAHHAAGLLAWALGDITEASIQLRTSAELSPLRSSRRTQYTDFLVRTGNLDEGKRALTELTEKVPDFLPPWLSLAEIAFAEKQFSNCVSLIKQTLKKDPENIAAQLLAARVQLAQGEPDKAIVSLDRLALRYEKSPQIHYFLATAYSMKNDTGKALQSVNRAVTLNPAFAEAVLLQAQLNIRRENPDIAIASLNQFVSRNPDLPQSRLLLINAHMAKQDLGAALLQCAKLTEQFPTNAQVILLTGTILQQQGRTNDALKQFERALELAPDTLQALEYLVDLYVDTRQYDSATKRVQAAIQRSGDSAVMQTLLSKALWGKGDTQAAERALLKAIELDPNFHLAYLFLAKLYVETGQKDQALAKLEETVKRNPRDISGLMMLGTLQYERKEYAPAAETYTRLLSVNPNFGSALNNLADIYSDKLGQLDKGYEAARKARDVLPGSPEIADTLGWILYKRGEYSRALGLLQESIEMLGNDAQVIFHLGMSHYMLGNEEAARKALERALGKNSDFTGREEAIRRLTILKADSITNNAMALATLEKLFADDNEDPIVTSRLADLYERNNTLDKAVTLYEQAVKKNPRNLPATIKLAKIYAGPLRDSKKAMQYAKAARSLAQDDPEIAHTLGRLAYESGDFAWSLSLLQESQRKLPENADVLYDLALSLCSVGKLPESQQTMQSALQMDAKLPRAESGRHFLELLSLYQNPANLVRSSAKIQEALRQNPKNLPALALSGLLQEQSGDTTAAKATYDQILQLYPLFAVAHKRLAVLQAMPQGDAQKAYDHAVKARTAFPEDAEVTKTLGILTYNRRDYARAAQLLREGAIKSPQDGELLAYLGLSQFQLKQKTEYQQTLRKALALNIAPALAEQANRALTQPN